MKVVYICPTASMYGDNIALINIMPFLIQKGVEPFFVLPHKREYDLQNVLESLGYKYKSYDLMYPGIWKGIKGFIKSTIKSILSRDKNYRQMISDIKAFSPDIIHTNTSGCVIGYWASKDLNIKHVWHIREYMYKDTRFHHFPSKYAFQKKIGDTNNYSICITEDIYKYFNKPFHAKVIYDGVLDTNNIPSIKKKENNYFLYVGRLVPQKGIETVIKVFLQFRKNYKTPIRLKIAGTGDKEYTNKLKQLANINAKESLIDFLGYRKDVYELMSNATALIVASRCEAFGFITAEAMFCGCPVIGHNTGGTKIQFDNGLKLNGKDIGFRYMTEKDLEKCMAYVAKEHNNIFPMLVDAQKTVVQLYSIKSNSDLIFQYYQSIIN